MTTKKQAKKKAVIDIGLRLFPEHAEEISRAVEIEAKQRGIFPSRNAFCAAASLAAARKVLKENERTSG
jgi:uncharacterized protein (DUF1778 family)